MKKRKFRLSNGVIIETPIYMQNQNGYLYNFNTKMIEALDGDNIFYPDYEMSYYETMWCESLVDNFTDGRLLYIKCNEGKPIVLPMFKNIKEVKITHNTKIVEEIDPPIVYVAGQMTGLSDEEYSDKFFYACLDLKKRGFKAYNSSVNKSIKMDKSYNDLLIYDIAELSKCDAIYMLNGWENSKGAKAERECANAFGLHILYESNNDKIFIN